MVRVGIELRMAVYIDAMGCKTSEFPTNKHELSPGVIVELSRNRLEAEKVHEEKKALGTNQVV